MRRTLLFAAAPLALLAGCATELLCPSDQADCGGGCVALAADPSHCGACGRACGAGEACRAGACTDCASVCGAGRCRGGACLADVEVACFATDEVRGVAISLEPAGPPRAADDGPVALAAQGGALWVSHALVPTLLGIRPGEPQPLRLTLAGSDLEAVRPVGDLLAVSDSGAGTLVVVDPGRVRAVDEVDLAARPGDFPNPLGMDFVGTMGYVALYGSALEPSFAEAQAIAVVDLSASASCVAPPCATVLKRIGLDLPSGSFTPGAYDRPGFPFPSRVARAGTRAFVTLSNLLKGASGFYTEPAGDGRLAVVDAAQGDALRLVDLGPGCRNPGGIAAAGETVWVACGASGAVVPVDVSGPDPVVGAPVPLPGIVPGNVTFCRGRGFVTDQYTGAVARFDPAGAEPAATAEVCPKDPVAGFAWAADVACGP